MTSNPTYPAEPFGHKERCLFWAKVFEHCRTGETVGARSTNLLVAAALRNYATVVLFDKDTQFDVTCVHDWRITENYLIDRCSKCGEERA